MPVMTIDQARQIARDVISGLEYLHLQGIIHRDIKPANLLRDKEGSVKISDFGVSYASSLRQFDNDEIELAKTAGTPAFFAPELCVSTIDDTERPPVTYKIDIWAFGVTLYCLLFGKVPFIAESEFELFDVVVNQPLTFPDEESTPTLKDEGSIPTSMYYNPQVTVTDTTQPSDAQSQNRSPSQSDPDLQSAKDLLRHVLEKDPSKRYTIADIKQHPWMLQGMDDTGQDQFLTEAQREQKIEVSNEEVQAAVVGIAGKIKRSLTKLGSHALHVTGIRRKSSTSSTSSFTSASSSRSNSVSRRGSQDTVPIMSRRVSQIAQESEGNALPARQNSTTGVSSESIYWRLDRELSSKSNNSSSTSISSTNSANNPPSNQHRGVSWKTSYSASSEIPGQRHGGSQHSHRGMPGRRISTATVASTSTQGSVQESAQEDDLASRTSMLSLQSSRRTISSSTSHLNIHALLAEPELPSEMEAIADPVFPRMSPGDMSTLGSLNSGLETPKASKEATFKLDQVPPDLDLTPNRNTYNRSAARSGSPTPKFPRHVDTHRSPVYGSGAVCQSPIQDVSASNEYNSSDSSESSSDGENGELVLDLGARPNAPSAIARRLAARNSESNLRLKSHFQHRVTPRAATAGISHFSSLSQAPRPSSPLAGKVVNSPLLEPAALTELPKSGVATVNVSTEHVVATPNALQVPSSSDRHSGTTPPGSRARSLSVAVGEIQHLRERSNFGLSEDEDD